MNVGATKYVENIPVRIGTGGIQQTHPLTGAIRSVPISIDNVSIPPLPQVYPESSQGLRVGLLAGGTLGLQPVPPVPIGEGQSGLIGPLTFGPKGGRHFWPHASPLPEAERSIGGPDFPLSRPQIFPEKQVCAQAQKRPKLEDAIYIARELSMLY
ncbi:hypothetical protein CEXT_683221 [Caerostris extrusa]|uniref:Uncharacterized protein n=1 Tax=Caerostris extrusa TaxID=172846 RepID=A0AAV4V9N4_CAEEX|nr:hypothetical protein CEXT_683221 [Caerostris extrusa]